MPWGMISEREEEENQYVSDSVKVRKLLRNVLKYRKESIIVIITVAVTSAAGMIGPLLIGLATNSIISRNFSSVIFLASVYSILYAAQYFAENRRVYHITMISQKVIKELRDSTFQTLQWVPLGFFSKNKTGRIISRVTNDAEALSDFLTFQLPQVMAGIMAVVASIAIMIYLDPFLTLISVSIIPVLLAVTLSLQKRMRKNFLETRKRIAAVTSNLSESISGMKVIQSFTREETAKKRFDLLNKRNMLANLKASRFSSLFGSAVQIIEASGIAMVLYAGSLQAFSGAISIGLLVAFVAYVQGFFNPVVQLSQFYNSYQSSMVGLDRIYRLQDTAIDDQRIPGMEFKGIKEKIEFKNVNFSFGNTEVIHGVSLSIKKGQRVALVGPTGAGKSTISNLLLRFYRPSSGTIQIDGENIFDSDIESYRKPIAAVIQDPFLFRASVIDNVRFSSPGVSEEEIKECIEQYGLGDVFNSLSKGLYTDVGERGTNISEGQRQAVSLVRAVIRNPEMIILDEATSQLDAETEEKIQNALELAMKDKTVIIIAHRLSTLRITDRIFYVDHGKIIEEGELEELMERGGKFASLYSEQFGLTI